MTPEQNERRTAWLQRWRDDGHGSTYILWLEDQLEAREAEYVKALEDFAEQKKIFAMFSPKIQTCSECDRYYPKGFVCQCGHDNTKDE